MNRKEIYNKIILVGLDEELILLSKKIGITFDDPRKL